MSFELSNGGYHSKNNRNESNNKICSEGDSISCPSATEVITSSDSKSFNSMEIIRATKRDDNFDQGGNEEDFSFMSYNKNNIMDLTEDLT